jgi:hypothetical protein
MTEVFAVMARCPGPRRLPGATGVADAAEAVLAERLCPAPASLDTLGVCQATPGLDGYRVSGDCCVRGAVSLA